VAPAVAQRGEHERLYHDATVGVVQDSFAVHGSCDHADQYRSRRVRDSPHSPQ
jgi:hypothetical protein